MIKARSGRSVPRPARALVCGAALLAALAVGGAAGAQAARTLAPAPGAAPVASVAAAPVAPASLVEAAAQIEALLASGQSETALAAARHFLRSVTARTGFGVSNARLTEAPAEGFGMFSPRAESVYRIGEPVYAYVEVNGFTLTPQPDGVNRMLFDVYFTLDNAQGEQMTDGLIPMGEVRIDSHSEILDAYIYLTYTVSGAEGAFGLRTRVVDRASGDTAEFVLPVEFRANPPEPGQK